MLDFNVSKNVIDMPIIEGSGETIADIMTQVAQHMDAQWQYVPEQSSEEYNFAVYVHVGPKNARVYLTIAPEDFDPQF